MSDHRPDPDRLLESMRQESADVRAAIATESVQPTAWPSYLFAAGCCVMAAIVAALLQSRVELVNIAMVFLLAVVVAGAWLGRGPALLAALLNVAVFDFLFVPPRFSLAVSDMKYVLTFAVMFIVALITGQLAAGSRYQARVAMSRELRARALYGMARELSAALQVGQIAEIAIRFIEGTFGVRSALLVADADDRLQLLPSEALPPAVDRDVAQWAFDHGEAAGAGTNTLPGTDILYLPLRAPMRFRGVLAVAPRHSRWLLVPEQRRLLDTFASLIALAVERVHYVDIARATTVQIESERLRNSLLAALSHDLRTPLTTLLGSAEYLELAQPPLGEAQREAAVSIGDEARRMAALVDNLLDMARLQAGPVTLDRQWQPLEEVVGAALAALRKPLAGYRLSVHLPVELPLVQFDAVLLERVVFNLVDNARKYAPPGSRIEISARVLATELEVAVDDDGPGLAPGMEIQVFEKFTRGRTESTTPGVGLGLAICRAIVEAHDGRISAGKSPLGGTRFIFTLPLGTPPEIDQRGLLPVSPRQEPPL